MIFQRLRTVVLQQYEQQSIRRILFGYYSADLSSTREGYLNLVA